MDPLSLQNRSHAAQLLSREAGLLALHHFRNRDSLKWESKGPQDWVSQADRAVEEQIRERLLKLFPEDGFLGEESGKHKIDSRGIWVVDPIDGTSSFLKGMPTWCVSLAFLLDDGSIPIGVIYQPCTDELYTTDPGQGARLNGIPMKPPRAGSMAEGIFGIGHSRRVDHLKTQNAVRYVTQNDGTFETLGSGALMVAYVACGRYIGYYEPHIHAWDCLAGISLVRSVGGWTSDFLADDGLRKGNHLAAAVPGMEKTLASLLEATE